MTYITSRARVASYLYHRCLTSPMQIPNERAFWILDYYRRHGTMLYLAAAFSGEAATSWVTITEVSAALRWIGIRLYDDQGHRSWDRNIPLGHARYSLFQMGDPSYIPQTMASYGYHSALRLDFPDGSTLCFSEQMGVRQHALAS